MLSSIIGIGLNVNQEKFSDLPNVSSLKLLTGRSFELNGLLLQLQDELKKSFMAIEEKGTDVIRGQYESVLFRKDKPSTFKDANGQMFMGFIRGISDQGKLVVALEDDFLQEYNMKEISLLY